MLVEGVARVVCVETYETHDFKSWSDLRPVDEELYIRTVRMNLRVPEVILIPRYDGMPAQGITFSRKNIYKRDNYTCQYCGRKPGSCELSIDHIIPRSRGGRSDWANCVLACVECNKKKGNKTLDETGMKLQRKPFRPEGTRAILFPFLLAKKSWESFISDHYWNVELERD